MKKLLITLAALVLLPLSSYGQDAFYVSGMLGLGQANAKSSTTTYDTQLAYGVRAGVLFNDHFGAGVMFSSYTDELAVGTANIDATLTHIMAEVTYYFNEADENGFWLSGLLGQGQSSLSCPSTITCSEDSSTAVGAMGGYHFMVAPNFSVSPTFKYINYISSDANTGNSSFIAGYANITAWF